MKKRVFSLAIVLMMLVSIPMQALAASHEVGDFEGMQNVFTTDSDAEVTVNLTNDITWTDSLTAGAGQTYTIHGNGHSMSDVNLTGQGTVNIEADLTVENAYSALSVNGVFNQETGEISEGPVVTVTGDVQGLLVGDSTVTIDGNVYGKDGQAPDAEGNLASGTMSEPGGFSDGAHAVQAEDCTITITGDVAGGNAYGSYGYGGVGLNVSNSTVTVGGNVTGGSVTADPTVQDEGGSLGHHAIVVHYASNITVGGNVTGGSTNGDNGIGGDAVRYEAFPESMRASDDCGSVTINGTAAGGTGGSTGDNAADGAAIRVGNFTNPDKTLVAEDMPEINIGQISGGAEAIEISGFAEETAAAIKESILSSRTNAAPAVPAAAPVEIEITVEGGESVRVTLTMADGVATVDIGEEELDRILTDLEKHPVIDCSSVQGLTELRIKMAVLQAILDVAGRLEVKFPGGSVIVDEVGEGEYTVIKL